MSRSSSSDKPGRAFIFYEPEGALGKFLTIHDMGLWIQKNVNKFRHESMKCTESGISVLIIIKNKSLFNSSFNFSPDGILSRISKTITFDAIRRINLVF